MYPFQVANMIRFLIDSYNKRIPAILEIPSKDHLYDPAYDSFLSRVKYLFSTELVASESRWWWNSVFTCPNHCSYLNVVFYVTLPSYGINFAIFYCYLLLRFIFFWQLISGSLEKQNLCRERKNNNLIIDKSEVDMIYSWWIIWQCFLCNGECHLAF